MVNAPNFNKSLSCIVIFTIVLLGSLYSRQKCPDKNEAKKKGGHDNPYFYSARGVEHQTATVWPMPQSIVQQPGVYVLTPTKFRFEYTSTSNRCRDVNDAVARSRKNLFGKESKDLERFVKDSRSLDRLYIHLSEPCERYPNQRSSENYVLVVKEMAMLTAHTQWGIMRGLETFGQLVHLRHDNALVVSGVAIEDYPRFKHRGLMLDTARHFLPVDVILKNLEIMSYNKLNVLHWHMTDHESFPIKFKAFPEIAEKGAFHSKAIYTEDDIERIIEFARKRGIRVIPEVDFPGHSLALSRSHPELFTRCVIKRQHGTVETDLTLNPLLPAMYIFVEKLYNELSRLFPDEYIHIGGDEVSKDCWYANANFARFVEFAKTTFDEIQLFLIEGLLQEARKRNLKPIVWNDGFGNGYTKTPATVQVWTGNRMGTPEQIVGDLTDGTVDVIVSYPWYLDHRTKRQWKIFYETEPTAEAVNIDHVLGGEICAWGEHVDTINIFSELWPMSSAAAERLWSHFNVTDIMDAEKRLKNFECILKSRGAQISSISPGHCFSDWQ